MRGDLELFCRLFEGDIRVDLNWKSVRSSDWPVLAEVLESEAELGEYYLPWYISSDGQEADFTNPDAKPIAALSWRQARPALSSLKQQKVARLAKQYETFSPPIQVLAACYDLGESRRLVLDGNHRIAALVEAGRSFRLLSLTLKGELSTSVLPDLWRWSSI